MLRKCLYHLKKLEGPGLESWPPRPKIMMSKFIQVSAKNSMTHFLNIKLQINVQNWNIKITSRTLFIDKNGDFWNYGTSRNEFDLRYYDFNHKVRVAIKKLIIDWKMTPQKVYGIVCTNLISVFFWNSSQSTVLLCQNI